MIFEWADIKAIKDGRRTAVIRTDTGPAAPFKRITQPIQRRRRATDQDPATLRERQASEPDKPAAIDTEATINITGQERRRLGDLTTDDIKRTGIPNMREFRKTVGPWEPDREVWFVTFELVTRDSPKPRFLANPGKGAGDYTNSRHRAIDDLEAVDSFTQKRLTRDADDRRAVIRAEDDLKERARTLSRAVREEALESGRRGVDISPELRQVERALAEMQRKRRQAA